MLATNLVPALTSNREWASLGNGTYAPLCLSWLVRPCWLILRSAWIDPLLLLLPGGRCACRQDERYIDRQSGQRRLQPAADNVRDYRFVRT